MHRRFAVLFTALALLMTPIRAEAQNRFDWTPGFMIPIGLDVSGGLGTWGSRVGLIVGKTTTGDDDLPRAAGAVLLAEAATSEYRAVGVGVAFAAGLGLGPVLPLSAVSGRLTLNRASFRDEDYNVRRSATGVSAALTYFFLSYGLSAYRVEAMPGLDAGWRWRMSFGLGF